MPLPLILVVPSTQAQGAEFLDRSVSLSEAYLEAVEAGGGLPWILSSTAPPALIAECVRRADGVLLTGGDDLQPNLYRPRVSPRLTATLSAHDPARDFAETCLIREVFWQKKPLLAICRGLQMLNVAFGGTLLVDIRTEVPGALDHCRMDQSKEVVHPIDVVEDSLLSRLTGKARLAVNSTHHQAAREVAALFRITGRSPDGVVEAMELGLAERHLLPYLLAVQFHPERLLERYPEFLEIFRGFTRACASRRKESI
jgi:putative glutamine amidotransferase